MKKFSYIISCDPGVTGGVSIFDITKKDVEISVNKMPVETIIKKRKDKKTGKMKDTNHKVYDLKALCNLVEPYRGKSVYFIVENVHSMPDEGSVSAFTFGRGLGNIEGIAVAMGFELDHVTPATWKKFYPDLETDEISKIRKEKSNMSKEMRMEKDKAVKKEKKKIVNRLGNRIKTLSKAKAREIAVLLVPDKKELFKPVNSDGMAESVLIGNYALYKNREKIK